MLILHLFAAGKRNLVANRLSSGGGLLNRVATQSPPAAADSQGAGSPGRTGHGLSQKRVKAAGASTGWRSARVNATSGHKRVCRDRSDRI